MVYTRSTDKVYKNMGLKCLNCIKQEAVRPTLAFLVAKSRRKVSLLASLVIKNITVFLKISVVFKDLKISIIKNIPRPKKPKIKNIEPRPKIQYYYKKVCTIYEF